MLSFLKNAYSFFFPADLGSNVTFRGTIIVEAERVGKLLNKDGSSFTNICKTIEEAKNMKDLKAAFGKLNDIMWEMSLIAPLTEQNGIICEILKKLKFSKKFGFYLSTAPTPREAIFAYKRAAVQELSVQSRKFKNFRSEHGTFEDALFAQYFPSTFRKPVEVEGTVQGKLTSLCSSIISPSRKRSFFDCTEGGTVHCTEMGLESRSTNKKTRFK